MKCPFHCDVFLNVAFSESLFCRQWLACVCPALLLFRYPQLPLISSLSSSVSSMNWSLIAQVLIHDLASMYELLRNTESDTHGSLSPSSLELKSEQMGLLDSSGSFRSNIFLFLPEHHYVHVVCRILLSHTLHARHVSLVQFLSWLATSWNDRIRTGVNVFHRKSRSSVLTIS